MNRVIYAVFGICFATNNKNLVVRWACKGLGDPIQIKIKTWLRECSYLSWVWNLGNMIDKSLCEEFALRRTPPKMPPTNLASFVFHHIPGPTKASLDMTIAKEQLV